MSLYNNWRCEDKGYATPFRVKGCKARVYAKEAHTYVKTSRKGKCITFILVGHKPMKGHPEYNTEWVYWTLDYEDVDGVVKPVPDDVVEKLVCRGRYADKNPVAKYVVKVDGRSVVRESSWGCSLTFLNDTILGGTVNMLETSVALMVLCHGKVNTFDEAAEVRELLNTMSDCVWKIDTGYYEKEKKETRAAIENLKAKIAERNAEFAQVCDKSADALNFLSERFGIEVSL